MTRVNCLKIRKQKKDAGGSLAVIEDHREEYPIRGKREGAEAAAERLRRGEEGEVAEEAEQLASVIVGIYFRLIVGSDSRSS